MRSTLYGDQDLIYYDPYQRKLKRNAQIREQYLNGAPVSAIAQQFGISVQRVHQIITPH